MAIAFLELFPAFSKQGAIVVEADEQDIRSPSQTIADMKWRGLAAGKSLLAIGAVMFFVGKPDASFNIQGDILRRRMASGVKERGFSGLSVRESGDVFF